MKDVHVLGVHPDGNQLILSDAEGARYSLQITDALRDACKVAPPLRPVPTRRGSDEPTPREIQELVRAGATAEDIAREFSTPAEKVRRYEGPILAERAHAARQAQKRPIGTKPDSPTLGDLVVDRLAARGVAAHSIRWDAVRAGHAKPWEIIVRFIQNAEEREAHWSLESESKRISAIDEEAAWLTERSVPAGPDRGFVPRPAPAPGAEASTEDLVESLNAQRGVRQEVDMSEFADDDDTNPPTGHSRVVSLAPSTIPTPPHGNAKASTEATDGSGEPLTNTLPGMEAIEPEPSTGQQRTSRKSRHRRSVPSWEEILYGSQPR